MSARPRESGASAQPLVCAAVREHMQAAFGLRHDGRERLAAGIEDAARFLGLTPQGVVDAMRTPEVEAALLSSLTTPESYFLRHVEQLAWVFRSLERRTSLVRMWSVGCARGEEPYSLAILALEAFGSSAADRVRIVASDVNTDAIRRARDGVYRAWSFRGVQEHVRLRFFDELPNEGVGASAKAAAHVRWRVKPVVRACVRFQAVNLARPESTWPGAQDVVWCRNVLLYLDAATFSVALAALHRQLRVGGLFVVSPAEAPFVVGPFEQVDGAPIGVFRTRPLPLPQGGGAGAAPPEVCVPHVSVADVAVVPIPVSVLPAPPGGREHALARVYELANRGQATRAMETVGALLRDHPLFAAGYLARAILRLEAGEDAKARSDLARARRLDPSLSVATLLGGEATGPRELERGKPASGSAEVDAVELASLERTLRRLEDAAAATREDPEDD